MAAEFNVSCVGSDRQLLSGFWRKKKYNSDKAFFETRSKVEDISNSVNLYGGSDGFESGGFSSNPDIAWPKDVRTLEPGNSAYVSLNLGEPKGPEIEFDITLVSKNGYKAKIVKSMNITDVEPVNQMPAE